MVDLRAAMPRVIVRPNKPKPGAHGALLNEATPVPYEELEICSRRVKGNSIEISVPRSPVWNGAPGATGGTAHAASIWAERGYPAENIDIAKL